MRTLSSRSFGRLRVEAEQLQVGAQRRRSGGDGPEPRDSQGEWQRATAQLHGARLSLRRHATRLGPRPTRQQLRGKLPNELRHAWTLRKTSQSESSKGAKPK